MFRALLFQQMRGDEALDSKHSAADIFPCANPVELSINVVVHSGPDFYRAKVTRRERGLMPGGLKYTTYTALTAVRDELRRFRPPVIVFNKSHSGSRLLARLVAEAGVFMGAHQNESNDSWDVLKLIEYLVERYYPNYGPLWNPTAPADETLPDLIREVFASHTESLPQNATWGWKVCETAYILPVLDFLFPEAHYLHLIRDGRDVAFTNHRAPNRPFWKKIYFNTDRILAWRGLRFHGRDYERRSHIYNAMHWANSVTVGRAYGAMLRERYLEVRYEDLCESFDDTATHVLQFIGAANILGAIEKIGPSVYRNAIHKYSAQPKEKIREVVEIVKPLLLSLGYLKSDSLIDVVRARVGGDQTLD